MSGALRLVLREHRALIGLVAGYLGAGFVLGGVTGTPGFMANLAYASSYAAYGGFALYSLALLLTWCRWSVRGPDGSWIRGGAGWREAWTLCRNRFLTPARAGGAGLVFVLIPLFLNAFGSYKASLPRIAPFRYDPALERLDRLLHGGRAPWEWLQPILGHPLLTSALDLAYYAWMPVTVAMVLFMAWSGRRELRQQFLLTFVLGWIILGTLGAYIFSSAGPVYFGAVTGAPNPYLPLLEYLHRVDARLGLTAVEVQARLWTDYRHGSATPFTGISAMPSMHVAMPLLIALTARRIRPALGAALTVFTGVVMLGAIHLAWHYAVDVYASLVAMPMIWWVAGRIARAEYSACPQA